MIAVQTTTAETLDGHAFQMIALLMHS